MLSLIGSALGLFSSAIPKTLDMWQDRADKAHELAVMRVQAEISLDQTAIDANIREVESIQPAWQPDQRLQLGGEYTGAGQANYGLFIPGSVLCRGDYRFHKPCRCRAGGRILAGLVRRRAGKNIIFGITLLVIEVCCFSL